MTFHATHSALMDLFSRYVSKNIAFRELRRADGWTLLDATRHPDFNTHLLWSQPTQIEELMPQVDRLLREHTLKKAVVLSAVERDSGTWKALLILKPFPQDPKGVEMSLYLHPSTWNSGAVFTTGCAVIQLMMSHLPDLVIYNRVMPKNRKMRKINESYGFEKIGDTSERHQNGEDRPLEIFRLNKTRWDEFAGLRTY